MCEFLLYSKVIQLYIHIHTCVLCLVTQLCPTLCDLMDCSPPGSSVQGILQARTLEWIAIPFSRGSSRPRDQTWVSCIDRQILYHLTHQGSLKIICRP